jgi:squalene-hopene cyclase-like protein/prenyltransferase/squalene oxidase-like repeat protein
MRWQVTAYALLGVVLVGGFVWFERSRPSARMVALVAALAALAVAGRLVFAAIPNVVATTDIVLITGFAVGAAPGFAVGALAAAVSNIWLGQGPWTPWEMAGWGMVGLGGAALATVTRGRLGRIGLAAACGAAGLAYGALLDLSVMVGYGGEQSLERYLAISARGVPFNVAHAAGNVALALAAAPALVRMISRYRSRFEFEWGPRARRRAAASVLPLSALIVGALIVAPADPARAQSAGAGAALRWIEHVQGADGGFSASPGSGSSAAITGWASLGLEAAGVNPLDVRRGGHSPIEFMRADLDTVRSTGDLERTILALVGAGTSPRRFGGRDLVGELRKRRSASGTFEGQVNLTAFGILALRAAGARPAALRRSAAWLRAAQNPDGGWGFRAGAGSDPDSTGAALQGLAAAANHGASAHRGASYLRRTQRGDGGFALAGSGVSNSQSTAWAIQGLLAAGANPAVVKTSGHSPLRYLASRQAGDGHYRYSKSSDQTPIWVTAQALVAVNRRSFPIAAVRRSGSGGGSSSRGAPSSGRSSPARAGGPSAGRGGPGGSPRSAATDKSNAPPRGTRSTPQSSANPATARPLNAALLSRERAGDGQGGEGAETAYVAGGFGLLITALVGGFLWYRRRLP